MGEQRRDRIGFWRETVGGQLLASRNSRSRDAVLVFRSFSAGTSAWPSVVPAEVARGPVPSGPRPPVGPEPSVQSMSRSETRSDCSSGSRPVHRHSRHRVPIAGGTDFRPGKVESAWSNAAHGDESRRGDSDRWLAEVNPCEGGIALAAEVEEGGSREESEGRPPVAGVDRLPGVPQAQYDRRHGRRGRSGPDPCRKPTLARLALDLAERPVAAESGSPDAGIPAQ